MTGHTSHAPRHYRIWADTPSTLLNAPPWTRSGHIHDPITHGEEHAGAQRLREEVREVINSRDEWTADHMILDELAHVEVATVDVLEGRCSGL